MAPLLRELRDSTKYGFGVGRVKVLETRLLKHSRVERLIEAESSTEQLHILAETEYGQMLDSLRTSEDVEKELDSYLEGVYGFLEEVCPDPEIVALFRLGYDFHNLKAILKAKYHGGTSGHMWSGLSRLDQEEISGLVSEGDFDRIPQPYRDALLEAVKVYEDTQDPRQIDVSLDKRYYQETRKIASEKKNAYLQTLVEQKIDLANFKVLFRARNLGKDKEFAAVNIIEGGTVSKDTLLDAYSKSLTDFISSFKDTPYIKILEKVRYRERDIDLRFFDKLIDNFLLKQAKRAKYIPVGVEVIIGYILAKENEINILRLILIGRLNGLSKKLIRERVRDLYV